jgi:hypothetical protein
MLVYSMYVLYVVCVSSVTMESMCSCLSFFVPSETLGENIFRGVWNKAQALVYVVFSVRVLLILM